MIWNRLSKSLALSGICTLLFGVVLKFMLFPKLLKWQMHTKINLKPGSDVRTLWSNVPFPIDFRIYLFNITNPDEIKNGKQPILREVGPYYFVEKHEKTNMLDHEKHDSVEYATKNTFNFKPENNGDLTGEEELIVPHIFMLSMIMATVRDKPSALPVVGKAINSIFKNPKNVFVKVKAMDLMFRGLPIDCSVKDFAGAAICGLLRGKMDELIVEDPDHFRFAIFGANNGTTSKNRIKILRGSKNQADIGRVIEFNGKKNISIWNDQYCDTLNGTDGYVFPPYLKENEDIYTFSPEICRSLNLYSIGASEVAGLYSNRYTAWLGDPSINPALKCYCPSTGCLKAGVMDLHKCTGIPLVASNPHFYRVHEDYLKMVDGLNPIKDKHETFIDFDLFSGTILQAKKRLQFNIMIRKLNRFKIMANFSEVLLPLFWIEEGIILPDEYMSNVKSLHNIVGIILWISVALVIVGLNCFVITIFVICRANKKVRNVIHSPQVGNNMKFSTTRPGPLVCKVNQLRPAKRHSA
ncbi:sensory neuron membrane protein 1-like [Phymastichus coffea]|uniref:sensory neuron membrane protein 1-like n=1 Tax=Phymastichus coffea TaxID=108790 RepID=UPI00273AECA7|nr:sensory neuron membrane protein 1-like [Phymastichus coffea]